MSSYHVSLRWIVGNADLPHNPGVLYREQQFSAFLRYFAHVRTIVLSRGSFLRRS
jgi:hypothetical protein